MTTQRMTNPSENDPDRQRSAALIALFFLGGYLLAVGVTAVVTGRWPIYLTPPIFDGMHGLLSMFGERLATYLMGGSFCALGLFFWGVCSFAKRTQT
jgi:hypothetical protein